MPKKMSRFFGPFLFQLSGIDFYRLQARQTDGGQAGDYVETKKMVLLILDESWLSPSVVYQSQIFSRTHIGAPATPGTHNICECLFVLSPTAP
jgi:hypothetical protein